MNYTKIYESLVEKAQNRKTLQEYYEKHHIIPKCLGGDNSQKNICKFTLREHFLAHWLLYRIYPTNRKLTYTFHMMCSRYHKKSLRFSSIAYKEAKEAYLSTIINRISPMKGKSHSQETKDRISNSKKGQTSWIGKIHSEESKIKMSNSALGRRQSNEVKKKISQSKLGVKYTQEHRNNISKAKQGANNPMFGKKWKLVDNKRVYYYPNSLDNENNKLS